MKLALLTRLISGPSITAGCLLLAGFAHAGVDYLDPVDDWRYTYDGVFDSGLHESRFVGGVGPAGYGNTKRLEALDGKWQHNQGDKWDGTAPGAELSDPSVPPDPVDILTGWQGTSPGGAASIDETTEEGETTYIRVQDAGNPEAHGWVKLDPVGEPSNGPESTPINTNRRIAFGHDITQDGALDSELILSETGTTVSFRVRIPDSGPLDDIYLNSFDPLAADFDGDTDADGHDFLIWQRGFGTDAGAGNMAPQSEGNANADQFIDGADLTLWQNEVGTTAGVVPWFENAPHGHGFPILNNRGMVNVVQNDTETNGDTMISFSLVTSQDIVDFCSASGGTLCAQLPANGGNGSGGLIMNNLIGETPSNQIGSDGDGARQILEIPDAELNEWNEFWITLENNDGAAGNILVKVYRNGSTTADEFNVTLAASGNSAYSDEDNPYLEFGITDTDAWGSFDMDFYSYQLEVIPPTVASGLALATTVPEPASLALLALGLLATLFTTSRCRQFSCRNVA